MSGGEKAKIIWKSKKIGNELINIYYSIDDGYNWILLSDRMVDTGFYIWDVPHLKDVFDNCLLKITTNSDKISKISKKFKIINETNKIRITYPNGGELIESGSWFNVEWDSDGLKSDLFKILFSSNGGRTWKRLESRLLNVNKYLWKVPEIESENCKIQIIAVENENIKDISEREFSISKKAKIKISSPSDQIKYYPNQNMFIKWNSVNVRGKKVNIYYSMDGGRKWKTIVRGAPNIRQFEWAIPDLESTSDQSKIKVELSNNIKINDINRGYFVLYGKPAIKMKSPHENNLIIEDNSTYRIIWDSKNIRENRINLYYSENSGYSWVPIAKDIFNKGYYNWIIPNLGSIDCIFKIESSIQPEIVSISDYSLRITGKALILIQSNFENKNFNAFDSLTLIWESYNLSDKYLDILFSIDNGKKWQILYENIVDDKIEKFEVPFIARSSSECKIKIVDSYDMRNFSSTNGIFSVNRPRGKINLLSSEIKEYNYNQVKTINWKSEYLNDKMGEIYYSLNKGEDWFLVDKISLSQTSYNWEIPNLEESFDKCLLKVVPIDAEYDFSDKLNFYKINAAPYIDIVNDYTDTVKTNMPFDINVNIKNSNQKDYKLYYSLSKGLNWINIDNKISLEKYFWQVPSLKGFNNILIKAELEDDDDIFSIVKFDVLEQSINLTLLSPNGNEKYEIGDEINIVWSIKKIYDKTIDLFYSVDGGLNWSVIELSARNSGTYKWIINENIRTSNNCKIKVQSNINNKIFDVSDKLFAIDGIRAAFKIITPNGGELIYKGTSTFIYWEDIVPDITKVDIFYSLNAGKEWFLIVEDIDNSGVYNWVIPDDIQFSKKCLIKIISSSDKRKLDLSDKGFTIK